MSKEAVEMGNKYTEAKARAILKYQKEHTATITFRIKKEDKPRYKALADRLGKSMSGMIIDLVEEKLKEEGL